MIKLIKKMFDNKGVRFLFTGGINTCVGYGTFALCIWLGLGLFVSQTASTVIGVINSYFWNKYFTFRQPKQSLSEIVRFISVYAANWLLGLLLLFVFVKLMGINAYAAGALGIVFTTVVSYFGHNFFSFKKKKGQKQDNGDTL